jgi:tetratricopeptide (TPR) repeat protein
LGETILEYVPSDVGSQILQAPARSLEQIQAEQEKLKQLKAERFGVTSLKTLFGSQPSRVAGEKKGNKNLLLIMALGAALFLVLGGDPEDQKKKSSSAKKPTDDAANKTANLSSYLPVPPDTARTIETLYKEGMREYFDGNYSRAKAQFETILEISPSHPLANLYLQNCDTAIKDAVKLGLDQGKKAFEAGKLRESRAFYAQVLRYLYRNRDNPAYKEAREQLDRVNKSIREGSTDK